MKSFYLIGEIVKKDTRFKRLQLNQKVKNVFEENLITYNDGDEVSNALLCILVEILGIGICILRQDGYVLNEVPSDKSEEVIRIIDSEIADKKHEDEQFIRRQTMPTMVCSSRNSKSSTLRLPQKELDANVRRKVNHSTSAASSMMNFPSNHVDVLHSSKKAHKRKKETADSQMYNSMPTTHASNHSAILPSTSSTNDENGSNMFDIGGSFWHDFPNMQQTEIQHEFKKEPSFEFKKEPSLSSSSEGEDESNDEEDEQEIEEKNQMARQAQKEVVAKTIAKIDDSLTTNDGIMVNNGNWFNAFLLKERQKIEEDLLKQKRQLEYLFTAGSNLLKKQDKMMKAYDTTLRKITKFEETYAKMELTCSSHCRKHFMDSLSQPHGNSKKKNKRT